MPAELMELHGHWSLGTYLSGTDQDVPEQGFRLARNVRVDRYNGAISSRPGINQLSPAQTDTSYLNTLYVSKLFTASADYHYMQVGNGMNSKLYRLNSSWAAPTLLSTDATVQGFFDANWIDGNDGLWKYGTNGTRLFKDNGTSFQNFGIAAPAEPPASIIKGTRQRTAIYMFEDHTQLTYANTFSDSDEANIKQEGTNSLLIQVSGGNIATAGLGFAGARSFHTGADDGAGNAAFLTDTSENFVTSGVKLGSRVRNTTDGCEGIVTRLDATHLYFDGGLTGGTQNDFDAGDAYEVYFNLDTFGETFSSGTDDSAVASKTTYTSVSTATFKTDGVQPGMTIWNTSNGTKATITGVTETTLTFTGGCSGATENDFDNGDTFIIVNDLVKDDDYIHLWVQTTTPENCDYIQLDFDLITSTYANAFRTDYYTIRLPMTQWFSQGANSWTELFIRKAEFTKIGTSTANWSSVRAFRITMHEGTIGSCSFLLDDLSLVGGYGIEGDYQYIAVYGNSVTGCRSSPPTFHTSSNIRQIVPTVILKDVKRHPIWVDLSNIDAPSDTQIDKIRLYRKGGTLLNWTLVIVLPDSTTSFTDKLADSMIILNEILEDDNDPPVSTMVTLMGPGSLNRLFGIYGRNRLAYSKAWQEHESRGENWPPDFYVTIGDGSSEALHGAVQDTNIFVWTPDSTYMVIGQSGTDVFVPVPLPQSRGLASRYGVAVGAGQVFFLAKDGIYSQKGSRQDKLTTAVDPFFVGQTVGSVYPINQTLMREYRLAYHPYTHGDEVVLTYSTDGTTVDKRLVLKRNPQTGEFTECFFDDTTGITGKALYVDLKNNQLLWGADDSRVYQLEVDVNTDNNVAIEFEAITAGFMSQNPMLHKDYKDFLFEANLFTESLAVTAYYNKSSTTEVITSALTGISADGAIFQVRGASANTNPEGVYRSISIGLAGSLTDLVKIFKLGFRYLLRPQDVIFFDTGELSFETLTRLWKVNIDWACRDSATWRLYIDGSSIAETSGTIATTGSSTLDRNVSFIEFPNTVYRSKNFRMTISTDADNNSNMQVYGITGWFRNEPEDVTFWDSDNISFDHAHALKRLEFDIDAPSNVEVLFYVGGTLFHTSTVYATSGRSRQHVLLPAGAKGFYFKVLLSSDDMFQVWGLGARLKRLGNPSGYSEKPLKVLEGQVTQKSFIG